MHGEAWNLDLHTWAEPDITPEYLQPVFIEHGWRVIKVFFNKSCCLSHPRLVASAFFIVDILNLDFLRTSLVVCPLIWLILIFRGRVTVTVIFLDYFNLIQLINEWLKHHGALKLRVQHEAHEVKWAVETAYVLQNTNYRVHIPLIYVVFRVEFENLVEV